jgi:hypothetical protein
MAADSIAFFSHLYFCVHLYSYILGFAALDVDYIYPAVDCMAGKLLVSDWLPVVGYVGWDLVSLDICLLSISHLSL